MNTTKPKLLNLVITMSLAVNLVMLGGLGYIASIDHHIKTSYTAMTQPVVVYVPKGMQSSGFKTFINPPTKP